MNIKSCSKEPIDKEDLKKIKEVEEGDNLLNSDLEESKDSSPNSPENNQEKDSSKPNDGEYNNGKWTEEEH
jgi:hypothetical protein